MRKNNRGFASLTPEQMKAVAAKGGKKAHETGRAHKFTSEQARIAGTLGGKKVSANKEYMAEIGKKGGKQKAANILARNRGEAK